jgi:hypothetical protein
MNAPLGWWEKKKGHGKRTFTKDEWLTYKEWAERWAMTQINWYRIRLAVEEAEARED